MNYRSDIEGLRAVAIIPVVLFHAFPNSITGGFVGVDVFFVISGYLITTIIRDQATKSEFSFLEFYKKRAYRLFPALIIVFASTLLAGYYLLYPSEYKQLAKHTVSSAAFFINFILSGESGYFDNTAETKPLLNLWSLAVEEQFYIFWPFIILIAARSFKHLTLLIGLVIILSFTWNIIFVEHSPNKIFFEPFGRFWELALGAIISIIHYKSHLHIKQSRFSYLKKIIDLFAPHASLIGLLLILLCVFTYDKSLAYPGYWALLPTIGAALIIASKNTHPSLTTRLLSSKLLTYTGRISYPLYLWHWPIISYLYIINEERLNPTLASFALLLSFVLAALTYQFIEKPIRNLASNIKKIGALIIGMLCIVIAAATIYGLNGLPHRVDNLKIPSKWDIECHDKEATPENMSSCLSASPNKKSGDIFLIGDSHAAQFSFPLKKVANHYNRDFYFQNPNNQYGIPHSLWRTRDVSETPVINHLKKVVDKGDFIAISFHKGRLNRSRDEHIALNKEIKNFYLEINFYYSFVSIINSFENKDVKFLLIADGPLLSNDSVLSACRASEYLPLRHLKENYECQISKVQDDHTRTRQMRVYKKLAQRFPTKVTILDPMDALYEGKSHYFGFDESSGRYNMFDRHHLTEYGAMKSYSYFKTEINKLINN